MCHFMNHHIGNKLIRTKDEESLNKENITIDSFAKDYSEINKIMNKLKDKIEKEIEEINKCYDIVDERVKKKFEEEHNKLYKEENNLREKFQTEVTKKKEYLQNYLSETDELIGNYNKINKGIKILEKEEKNIIKILSYVSNINKNIKKMDQLIKEFITNLKITFEEEQRKLIYKDYIFNGLPIPKNIKCEDISSDNFKLKWEIDEDKLNKLDKNKIKYKIEINEKVEIKEKDEIKEKKDDDKNEIKNERLHKEFLSSDKSCNINDLSPDAEYEYKIWSIYNDVEGEKSIIQNVKTSKYANFSNILMPPPSQILYPYNINIFLIQKIAP